MGTKFVNDIRQLAYPKSFRIPNNELPGLEKLKDLMMSLNRNSDDGSSGKADNKVLLDIVSELGVIVWRLQKRASADLDASEILRRISRDVEIADTVLNQGDILIKDYTGQYFDSGMGVEVISFQPAAGISREQIIETIKPAVYYKNKLIHIAQVIVGKPLK